jgi:type IV pilus assembly protein PilP
MKKITFFLIMLLVLLPIMGCKKKQAPAVKPAAKQVQPVETELKPEAKKVEQEVYVYDPKGKRDPFLSLVMTMKQKPIKAKGLNPFESYSVDEIKLLAIAWDDKKHYALIMLPDKKSYTITTGMKLGLYGGKVEKITENTVVIKEYIRDYRGNIKPKDSILKLRKEEGE